MKKIEKTRTKVVDAASRSFRKHGFSGVGVDGIAKAAGVTSGAFYAHLGSKDAAFKIAVEKGLDEVIEALPEMQRTHGAEWVNAFSEYYLGHAHRENLACGCAMASLTGEVVRGDKELHALYEEKMTAIARIIADGLNGEEQERKTKAWALLSLWIGGVNIARALKTQKEAEGIKASIKAIASGIARPTQRV